MFPDPQIVFRLFGYPPLWKLTVDAVNNKGATLPISVSSLQRHLSQSPPRLTKKTREKLSELSHILDVEMIDAIHTSNLASSINYDLWMTIIGHSSFSDIPRTRDCIIGILNSGLDFFTKIYGEDISRWGYIVQEHPFSNRFSSIEDRTNLTKILDEHKANTEVDALNSSAFFNWIACVFISLLLCVIATSFAEWTLNNKSIIPPKLHNHIFLSKILPEVNDKNQLEMPVYRFLEHFIEQSGGSIRDFSKRLSGEVDAEDLRRQLHRWLADENVPEISSIEGMLTKIFQGKDEEVYFCLNVFRVALAFNSIIKELRTLVPEIEDKVITRYFSHYTDFFILARNDMGFPISPQS